MSLCDAVESYKMGCGNIGKIMMLTFNDTEEKAVGKIITALADSMIVSQLPVSSWYDLFVDSTYADACLDRMIHKAYRLELNGKNMRNPW